jgi:hypothetical protein
MTDLRTAALRALEWADSHGEIVFAGGGRKAVDGMNAWAQLMRIVIGQPNRAQAMRDAGYTRRPTLREMAEPAEPCNKSCAPGYCYCEPIIKPEIKGHNVEPPPEAQTEAEKIAYCAGWWAAMEAKREQAEPVAWLDAERYRWLRTAGAWESEIGLEILSKEPDKFDAAVDAARNKT